MNKQEANLLEKKDNALKAIGFLQKEVNNIKEELRLRDEELRQMEDDKKILRSLYQDGVIVEHGNLLK